MDVLADFKLFHNVHRIKYWVIKAEVQFFSEHFKLECEGDK